MNDGLTPSIHLSLVGALRAARMQYIVYMYGIIVQLIVAKLSMLRSNSISKINWMGNAPFSSTRY